MKLYSINKKNYSIRDFTFAEDEKVYQIRKELAPELFNAKPGQAIKNLNIETGTKRLVEILNFILQDENGEPALLTIEDLDNTGKKMFANLIGDFLIDEILFQAEKKKESERLIKELNLPTQGLKTYTKRK